MSTCYTLQMVNVMKGLAQLWKERKLCDVKLIIEGQEIPAHKNVLAAASEYFYSMFLQDFKESKRNQVKLEGVTHAAMQVILSAIYTTELKLTDKSVGEVLVGADFLQINEISEKCEQHMIRNLNNATCFRYLKFFEICGLNNGRTAANDFIMKHFTSLRENEEFLEISKDALCSYLHDQMLDPENEIEVFRTAKAWIDHDRVRKQFSAEILHTVRLASIPSEILRGEIRNIPFMCGNDKCMNMLLDTFNYQNNVYTQPIYNGPINKPRGKPSLFIVEAGERDYDSDEQEFKFDVVDHETKMWYIHLDDLSMQPVVKRIPTTFAFESVSLVVYGNFLFLFGVENTHFSPVSMRYDATEDKWIDLEPVPDEATVGSSVVRIGDVIIMAGGMCVEKDELCDIKYFNCELSQNVHKYHIPSNTWTAGKELPEPLAYAGACEFNGMMYVSGGCIKQDYKSVATDKVWAYDLSSDTWFTKPKLPYAMRQHCLAPMNNTLYAFGERLAPRKFENYASSEDVVAIFSEENETWHSEVSKLSLENISYIIHDGTVYIIDREYYHDYRTNWVKTLQPDGQIKKCDGQFCFPDFTVAACAFLSLK